MIDGSIREEESAMDYSVLEASTLFRGIPARELREDLERTPHHIQCYDKGETVFFLMEEASRVGVVLEGHVQAQKTFPNGSQVNVSLRGPGELVGPAAVFSAHKTYPCDVVAVEPSGAAVLQRHSAEGGLLAADAGKADGQGRGQDTGVSLQMGDDDERVEALPPQGAEEAGGGGNRQLFVRHRQDY